MLEKPNQCAWCHVEGTMLAGPEVSVVNPQVTLPHELRRCPECHEWMVDVIWHDRVIRHKVREHPRRFRKSQWVVIYPVTCVWCGSTNTEAYEINATIANPISTRFKYDIYRCLYCKQPNAVSYLGEVHVHKTRQDKDYITLWYLED